MHFPHFRRAAAGEEKCKYPTRGRGRGGEGKPASCEATVFSGGGGKDRGEIRRLMLVSFFLNFSFSLLGIKNHRLKKIFECILHSFFFSFFFFFFFLSYQLEWNLGEEKGGIIERIICVLVGEGTKRWSKVKYGRGWVCLIYTCRGKRGGGEKMNRSNDVYIGVNEGIGKVERLRVAES